MRTSHSGSRYKYVSCLPVGFLSVSSLYYLPFWTHFDIEVNQIAYTYLLTYLLHGAESFLTN